LPTRTRQRVAFGHRPRPSSERSQRASAARSNGCEVDDIGDSVIAVERVEPMNVWTSNAASTSFRSPGARRERSGRHLAPQAPSAPDRIAAQAYHEACDPPTGADSRPMPQAGVRARPRVASSAPRATPSAASRGKRLCSAAGSSNRMSAHSGRGWDRARSRRRGHGTPVPAA